jgi:hypothetical protein
MTVVDGGELITGRWLAILIIGGMLPGMLLHARRECDCFVLFTALVLLDLVPSLLQGHL